MVVGEQHPQRGLAGLSGQLGPVLRIDDGPRVHDGDRRLNPEDLGPFQKERAHLRVEEGEALVHLDLRPVRFDLRKVRVQGEVGDEVRGHAVLEVGAHLGTRLTVDDPTRALVERAVPERGERRLHLQVAAGRQAGHPVHDSHLRQEPGDVPRDRRPHDRLVLVPDLPDDLESPGMRHTAGPRRIPQALERDRHLGREPVRDRLAAAQEKGVPRSVATRHAAAPAAAESAATAAPAAAAADDGIALHAVAVHREHVRALLIEKRVEVDRDGVVAKPARSRSTRFARMACGLSYLA